MGLLGNAQIHDWWKRGGRSDKREQTAEEEVWSQVRVGEREWMIVLPIAAASKGVRVTCGQVEGSDKRVEARQRGLGPTRARAFQSLNAPFNCGG